LITFKLQKDLKALQEQINDKCEQKQKEKALEEAWLRETQRQQGVIRELQRRSEEVSFDDNLVSTLI
jgi:hypothetical protein